MDPDHCTLEQLDLLRKDLCGQFLPPLSEFALLLSNLSKSNPNKSLTTSTSEVIVSKGMFLIHDSEQADGGVYLEYLCTHQLNISNNGTLLIR